MAKHRKTRREKIRSEYRQKSPLAKPSEASAKEENRSEDYQYSFSSQLLSSSPAADKKEQAAPSEYMYIKKDLIKTGIVTGSILAAELMLFFFIR